MPGSPFVDAELQEPPDSPHYFDGYHKCKPNQITYINRAYVGEAKERSSASWLVAFYLTSFRFRLPAKASISRAYRLS